MEETLLRESLIGIAKLLRKNQEMQFMLQREMANLYRHLAIPSDPQSLAVGVADPVAVQQGKLCSARSNNSEIGRFSSQTD